MITIKKFKATDLEFKELARVDNLVNHDCIYHPDDDKNDWKIRDKSLVRDRLLLYNDDVFVYKNKSVPNNCHYFKVERNEFNKWLEGRLTFEEVLGRLKQFQAVSGIFRNF